MPDSRTVPKVIVIGPGGGHLAEAMLATDGVLMERIVATYCEPHTRESMAGEQLRCLMDPHGSLWKYVVNAMQGLLMLLRDRPQAIVSTGGGLSIATALIGKLLGVKLIYVESGARVNSPSRTGKLLYRYADLFIVQWEPMLQHFPKAVYGGMLF